MWKRSEGGNPDRFVEGKMKRNYVTWGIVLLGILLLFTGAVGGNSVLGKLADSLGSHAAGRVVVSIAKEAASDFGNLFTVNDVKKLSEQPGTGEPAAAAESIKPVGFDDISVTSVIRGVTSNFYDYDTIEIVKGSIFTEKDEKESNRVAVLDEELALELFKTVNAVGNRIKLYDKTFRVVGVAARDTSILGILSERKEPVVYIPVNVLLELDRSAGISSIRTATAGEDLLGGNEDTVTSALRAIGKNPSNYIIEDYGIKEYLMRQTAQLVIFIPGLAVIFTLAVLLINVVKRTASILLSAGRTDYFGNVLKNNKGILSGELTRAALLSGSIYAVWFGIRFRIFIPQNNIPDDLTDLSYYFDLLKENILQGNSQIGCIPPVEGIILANAQKVICVLTVAALAVGIPLILAGFYRLKLKGTSLFVLAPVCSAMTMAAAAMIPLAAVASGMSPDWNTKGILVLFSFVFINMILFSKERDEVF